MGSTKRAQLLFPRPFSDTNFLFRPQALHTLQVGHCSAAGLHQFVGLDTEHVVPGSRGRPHLVVLQQVRVDEHPQLLRVTERGHATVGFGTETLSGYLGRRRGRETSSPPQFGHRNAISVPHVVQNVHSKLHITAFPASVSAVLQRSHTLRISNI